MTSPRRLAAALLATAALAVPAAAAGTLQVRDAFVRPTPPGAPAASAHLVIANPGPADDRLVAVSSPDAVRVEVHAMDMAGGVMRMRPAPGPQRVPAGGVLDMSPASGRHLMLVGPRRALRAGDHVRLRLRFAGAGERAVDASVAARP